MLQCPIEYFTDNLIFTKDKSCWAVYELTGYSYDMLSNGAKLSVLDRLTLFLANVPTEADIIMIPVRQDLDRAFKALRAGLREDDVVYRAASRSITETLAYLRAKDKGKQGSNDYRTFFICKLARSDEAELMRRASDRIQFLFKSIVTDFTAFMAADSADIPEARIRAYQRDARQIEEEQRRRVSLQAVDADTIQWLLRRMTYRGTTRDIPMLRPVDGQQWTPHAEPVQLAGSWYRRPRTREIVNLVSGEIYQEHRCLRIEHADAETSYQTFLVITSLPESQLFPGNEWIYKLQQRGEGAEICLHVRAIEHREGLKKIDDKRQEASAEGDNLAEARSNMPADLYESMREIEELSAELKAGKSPLLEVSAVICVADTDRDRMSTTAKRIRQTYEDDRFVVEQPLADQLKLFIQCMPATSFTVADFIQRLPPSAAASGIFGASRELGTPTGCYIGTTGTEEKHVFEDFRQACLSNLSACATFFGNLGYGKSFNADLLLYLHILYTGAYGLVIDPKGERSHWPEKLPALRNHLTLVTLTADAAFRGTLDPFNVFRDNLDEACDLAINVISELFRLHPKDIEYTALLDACAHVRENDRPSMLALASLLESYPEEDDLCRPGKLLARRIRLTQMSGMARLLVGDGTEQAIKLDNRLNILQIQNLKLPSPDASKEDYSQDEQVSYVLMMVVSAFCRRFIHSQPDRFKVILIDESWFLSRTVEGEKLISYAARMSRSLYASLILNGHSVTDLPNEGVRNAITYKFCFHTDNTDEARRMLEYMRLEPTPGNIKIITDLKNRQALYQDAKGRVGVLTFDAVFSDLIEVFDTKPKDESADAQAAAREEEKVRA